jgi:hypothetical protein
MSALVWPPAYFPGDPLAAMDAFYAGLGFKRVEQAPADGDVVALYAHEGRPTHVALRTAADPDWWESKLGKDCRIIHRLEELVGDQYGTILAYYVRSKTGGTK